MKFKVVLMFALMLAGVQASAQDDVYEMSLDELLDMDVSVASIKAKSIREQAGIVSVITREEISESGARDLEDILMKVPGFTVGLDVTGVTGMGLRGFWAYLGQIVVIIDDVEITDSLFGVFPTGSHIPAEQIERVEVIRGPGSAMYGGNAELAVIKITTRGGGMEGVSGTASLGTSGGELSHRFAVSGGDKINDLNIRYGASLGSDYRSDRNFTGYDGVVFDMSSDSDIKTTLLNLGMDYKGLAFTTVYDSYHLKDRTYYGEPTATTFDMNFDTFAGALSYEWKPSEKLVIKPIVTYNSQNPWVMENGALEGEEYIIESTRMTYNLNAIWTMSEAVSLLLGGEFYDEEAIATNTDAGTNLHFADYTADRISYDSTALYAQYEIDTSLANFTVGGRYQDHSYAGDSFVPRFGVTKVMDKFHAKVLYSQSFRTPQIEIINYASGGPVSPEQSVSYEVEMGYQLSDKVSVVGNVFHVTVEDILVFDTFEGVDTYANWEELSNYGFEGEVRIRDQWGNASMGYSFYRPDTNTVGLYTTSDENLLVGMPAHKLIFNGTYKVSKKFSLNANGVFQSKRLAYTAETVGESVEEFDPTFIGNLFAQYHTGRYTAGVGVKDLFNQEYDYVQPANSWMPPMPDKSRELFVRVSADF